MVKRTPTASMVVCDVHSKDKGNVLATNHIMSGLSNKDHIVRCLWHILERNHNFYWIVQKIFQTFGMVIIIFFYSDLSYFWLCSSLMTNAYNDSIRTFWFQQNISLVLILIIKMLNLSTFMNHHLRIIVLYLR